MAASHTYAYTWTRANGQSALSFSVPVAAISEVDIVDLAIAAAQTNFLVTFVTITLANVVAFFLSCDQTCTVKTNSSGSPTNTINLIGGQPYVWTNLSYIAIPLASTTLTSFYVTNTPAIVNFNFRCLTN
jgi:hypothetical protein